MSLFNMFITRDDILKTIIEQCNSLLIDDYKDCDIDTFITTGDKEYSRREFWYNSRINSKRTKI